MHLKYLKRFRLMHARNARVSNLDMNIDTFRRVFSAVHFLLDLM